jgi:hypothetical protein
MASKKIAIALRRCERSEAIQIASAETVWIASLALAMTAEPVSSQPGWIQ